LQGGEKGEKWWESIEKGKKGKKNVGKII